MNHAFSRCLLVGLWLTGWGPAALTAQTPAAPDRQPEATSLLGQPLVPPPPATQLVDQLKQREKAHRARPDDPDALIWYGRFLAYNGRYRDAVTVFSQGVAQFPDDPRMLRHRGHRYITLRQFDKAIADFDQAVKLIEGQPDEIEPDGMPNLRNIPVSTLQGNIWYHKGLAHYLNQDMPAALAAYRKCRSLGTNDDNTVSTTHWIYMILRRMGRPAEASQAVQDITADMDIIENFSYHQACRFYREGGPGPPETQASQTGQASTPADDALQYAVGNWYLYSGDPRRARRMFERLVTGGNWATFGHIAAEADLARMNAEAESGR